MASMRSHKHWRAFRPVPGQYFASGVRVGHGRSTSQSRHPLASNPLLIVSGAVRACVGHRSIQAQIGAEVRF